MIIRSTLLALGLALAQPALGLAQTAPATTSKVTPETRAAARTLMEAMGGTKQAVASLDGVRNQLVAVIARQSGKPAAEVQTVLDEVLLPELRSRVPELQEAMAELWAGQLTVAELDGLTEFYRGPLGQRLVEVSPVIGAQTALLGMSWGQRVAAEAIAKHQQTLRERGLKI